MTRPCGGARVSFPLVSVGVAVGCSRAVLRPWCRAWTGSRCGCSCSYSACTNGRGPGYCADRGQRGSRASAAPRPRGCCGGQRPPIRICQYVFLRVCVAVSTVGPPTTAAAPTAATRCSHPVSAPCRACRVRGAGGGPLSHTGLARRKPRHGQLRRRGVQVRRERVHHAALRAPPRRLWRAAHPGAFSLWCTLLSVNVWLCPPSVSVYIFLSVSISAHDCVSVSVCVCVTIGLWPCVCLSVLHLEEQVGSESAAPGVEFVS